MRIIVLTSGNNVVGALVVKDEAEDEIVKLLADDNMKLKSANRVHIHSQRPDDFVDVINWLIEGGR